MIGSSNVSYGVVGASVAATAAGVYGTSTNGAGGIFGGGRAALNLVPKTTAGKPTTGAHYPGDLVVDSAGALFLCTAPGTPGTWVKVTVSAA